MNKKKPQKNITFPVWVNEIFENEVIVLEGVSGANSLIASAAIIMFSEAAPATKKEFVARAQHRQLDIYDDIAKDIVEKSIESRQAVRKTQLAKKKKRWD